MSKADTLAELPKLTAAERQEVRLKLARLDGEAWLDPSDPLTDAEKALLDTRLAASEEDPDAGSSWEEVEARTRPLLPGLLAARNGLRTLPRRESRQQER
jgi:putative addiction module component (TIGR02574 family)